jgi:hypothetical protein
MRRRLAVWLACGMAWAQMESGEIRLTVVDATGLGLPAAGTLSSEGSETRRSFETDASGRVTLQHLAYGAYRLAVERAGFAGWTSLVEIGSAVPREVKVTLGVEALPTEVTVSDSATLLDAHRTGVVNQIGEQQIQEQESAIPSRGLLELINMQPGWLFESNAVLHPRGSEYQTLFVVDGVPMDENRSPGFAPDLETAEVSEMSVLTGNFPAEYGRKLGGVIEVVTARDSRQGFHGEAEAGGGSFDTATGLFTGSYGWKRMSLAVTGSADHTDHYLDPPVLGNYTNAGSSGSLGAAYDWDISDADRIHAAVHRRETGFEVPNENLQEAAGQRQDRNGREDEGQIAWTHEFSPATLLNLRTSVEDLSANLWSNDLATPIVAFQQRGFRRSYFNGTVSERKGRHEIQYGADGYYAPVSEALQYRITDPSYFDAGTPPSFNFAGRRLDREQALFAQDNIRLGNLTVSAGLRWDHYRLVVKDSAFSPRLGAAWSFGKAGLALRFSYDRVFLTPAMENLLLASSPAVDSLNDEVLRIAVRPSHGNYLEAGFSKTVLGKMRLDASFYRRTFNNYADDDVFLNTGISFPIAFQSAEIRGVDAKLELPRWGRFSGFIGYSNMLGMAQLPVAGGLFLGDDAAGALGTGSFPISQDQRNTARARVRYQAGARLWFASTAEYGSGLPVDIDGNIDAAALVAEYGQAIVNRVNFSAGRVRPNFSLDASAGADLWKQDKKRLRLVASGENLTGRLNVINFAGLFSGTGIGPGRSATARLEFGF